MPKYFPLYKTKIVQVPIASGDEVLYDVDTISRIEYHPHPIEAEDTLLISNMLEYHPYPDDTDSSVIATATADDFHPVPEYLNTIIVGIETEIQPTPIESESAVGIVSHDTHPIPVDESSATISTINEFHPVSEDTVAPIIINHDTHPVPFDDQAALINIAEYHPYPIDENFILAIAFADEFHPYPNSEETLEVLNLEDSIHPYPNDENSAILSQLTEFHPVPLDDQTLWLSQDEIQNTPTDDQAVVIGSDLESHPVPVEIMVTVKIGDDLQTHPIPLDELMLILGIDENQSYPDGDTESIAIATGIENAIHPIPTDENTAVLSQVQEEHPGTMEEINVTANGLIWVNQIVTASSFAPTGNMTDTNINTAATRSVSSSGLGGLTSNTVNFNFVTAFPDRNLYWLNIIDASLEYGWACSNSNALALGANSNVNMQYSVNAGSTWTTMQNITGANPSAARSDETFDLTAAFAGLWDRVDDLQFRANGSITSGTGTLVITSTQTFSMFYARLNIVASLDEATAGLLYDYLDDSSQNQFDLEAGSGDTFNAIAPAGASKFIAGRDFQNIGNSGLLRVNANEFNLTDDMAMTIVFALDEIPGDGVTDYLVKYADDGGVTNPIVLYIIGTGGGNSDVVFRYGLDGASTQIITVISNPSISTIYKVGIRRAVDSGVSVTTYAIVNDVEITPHVFSGPNTITSKPNGTFLIGMNNNAANVPDGQIYDVRIWDYAKPINELQRIVENVGTDIPRGTELACYRLRDIADDEEYTKEYFDYSGHDIDIVESNGITPTSVIATGTATKWSEGLHFPDLTGQHLSRVTDAFDLTGDMAISVIFRLNTHTTNGATDHLIRYGNTANQNTGPWSIVFDGGVSTTTVKFTFNSNSTVVSHTLGNAILNANNFIRICRIGTDVFCNLNGALTSFSFTPPIASNSGGTLTVAGNQNNAGFNDFDIFDIRIWDYGKPPEAIDAFFDNNWGNDEPLGDELACYRFYDAPYPDVYIPAVTEISGTNFLELTNTFADSQFMSFFGWIYPTKFNFDLFFNGGSDAFLRVGGSGQIIIAGDNAPDDDIVEIITANNVIRLNEWQVICVSVAAQDQVSSIFVNDQQITPTTETYTALVNRQFNYSDNAIRTLGSTEGGNYFNGKVSQYWFDTTAYIDFTSKTIRENFYTNGRTKFLGNSGQLPRPFTPEIYLREAGNGILQNFGTKGNLTNEGLTLADITDTSYPQFRGKH